jgi:hypothetical protein
MVPQQDKDGVGKLIAYCSKAMTKAEYNYNGIYGLAAS